MDSLWHICAKVRVPIELPFGVISGVSPGIGVMDGVHIPQGKGRFWWFFFLHWQEGHLACEN